MENDKTVINEIENISDAIFEHFSFVVDKGQSPLRIDKFLMTRIENATRNKIQQAAKAGYIFVGEKTVKSNYKVKKGDKIKVLFDHPPYQNLLKPEPISLKIIYEDDPIGEYNLLALKDVKKVNMFSRLLKSLNYLIWGDV